MTSKALAGNGGRLFFGRSFCPNSFIIVLDTCRTLLLFLKYAYGIFRDKVDGLEGMEKRMGILASVRTMGRTALAIDKKSLLTGIAYHLVKQLMNVFYGVYFIRMILEGLETGRGFGHILAVLGMMLGINILFGRLDQYYKNVFLPVFRLKADCYMNEKVMEKANAMPYDTANSASELDRYGRVLENSSGMMIQMYQSFCQVCGLVEAFAMILFYLVRTDVFAVAFSAFPLLYSYFLGERSAELGYELNKKVSSAARRKDYARRVHYLREYAAEMRTSGIGRVVRGIYREGSGQAVAAYRREGKRMAVYGFLELLSGDALSMALPLGYVAVRMLCGARYLLGDFIGITQAISIFSSDVEWMLDTALEMKEASLYLNEYTAYLAGDSAGHLAEDVPGAGRAPGPGGPFRITFDHVRYRYPGSPESGFALDDVSVDIRSGEKIAIVGKNGAGKSTFVSLLVNLISCSGGRIALNGRDLDAYDREALKSFFGVACQDYRIYPVSVRDNVSMGGGAGDRDIRDALEKVGLGERIPDIDAVIGKEIHGEGLVLSGGERQRLALARVIANPYPVVVLDEPTSALDALTERDMNRLILDALRGTGRTLLFISHKLSTTRLVDRILVFDGGRLVEEGDHAALMEKKGLYAEMYLEQSNLYRMQEGQDV